MYQSDQSRHFEVDYDRLRRLFDLNKLKQFTLLITGFGLYELTYTSFKNITKTRIYNDKGKFLGIKQ